NIIFTFSLILFPSELLVWLYYFLRYVQLEDVTFSEAFVLSFVETIRQIVRTAGMLYELLFHGTKKT
ncbi:MAG: hypothetical protein ACP5IT_10440, partial [Thermoproteota archaeon]